MLHENDEANVKKFSRVAFIAILTLMTSCSGTLRKFKYGLYVRGHDEGSRIAIYDSNFEDLAQSNCESAVADYEVHYPHLKGQMLCQKLK